MINDLGLAIIKHFEKCRLVPYRAPEGKWTVGWGRQLQCNPSLTLAEVKQWLRDKGLMAHDAEEITQEMADRMLSEDVARAAAFVAGVIHSAQLTSNQRSALISFVYNVGTGTFLKGSVDDLVNAGKHDAVPEKLQEYRLVNGAPSKGLERRRAVEAFLYSLPIEFTPALTWEVVGGPINQEHLLEASRAPQGSMLVVLRPRAVG